MFLEAVWFPFGSVGEALILREKLGNQLFGSVGETPAF